MSDIQRVVNIPLVFTIPESNGMHRIASITPVEMLDEMILGSITNTPLFIKFLDEVTARGGQEDKHPADSIRIELLS